MKKIFYIITASVILLACNQQATISEHEAHANSGHIAGEPLALNNGNKWKADSSTNRHVMSLKTMSDDFKQKPTPSVADYHLLAADLIVGLNGLIQDCKMSGEDHDALHKWLEPVLKETNQMKSDLDTDAADVTYKSISKRLDAYYNYFE